METSTLSQQVESVERSVTFLQQEHLVLLTGLRLEIRHLKKRCTELTCELNEKLPGRTGEDIELEEELLQARLLEADGRLTERECSLGDARAELRRRGTMAAALQVRLRNDERRFLDELKRRGHKITALSRQLRRQTDASAHLSFQLHSERMRLYHQAEEEEEEEEEGGEEEEEEESEWLQVSQLSPVMAESRNRSHVSAKVRRAERVWECVPRERVLGPEEPCPMPDPALFLYPFRHRLLPLHRSLGGRWREDDQSGDSERRRGRLRDQSQREEAGPESTEL